MPNSNIHSIVKGSAVTLAAQLISGLLASAYTIYILKKLQPADYGAYVVYIAITLIILTIQNLRLDDAITRFVGKPYSKSSADIFKTSFAAVFITSIAICSILLVFAPNISNALFHDLKYTNFLKIMFVSTTLTALFSPFRGLVYGLRRFTHLAAIEAGIVVVNVCVGFFLLTQGYGIIGVALGMLIGRFVGLLSFTAVCIPELKFLGTGKISKSESGPLFRYSLPLAAQVSIGMIGLNLDRIVLSGMKGVEFAAVQGLIIALVGFIDMFIFTVTRVLFPFMKDEFDRNGARALQGYYNRMIKYYFLIALLPLPVLVVLPGELLGLIAREEYLPYAGLLWVACIHAALRGWGRANGNVIMTTKDTPVILKLSIVTLFLSIVLNYYLIGVLGVVGANISLALVAIIGYSLVSMFLWKRWDITLDFSAISRLLVAILLPLSVTMLFIFTIAQHPYYKFVVTLMSYPLILFCILKMNVIDEFEKDIIKRALHSVKDMLQKRCSY